MTSLTTRQRDILKILLQEDHPLGTGDIASSVQLSARQVSYSMKGINQWLKSRDVRLETKPGVGIMINCQPEQKTEIIQELEKASRLQLVLSPDQRQQLICFIMLFETEPVILTQLAHLSRVSRTTIVGDLEVIEDWLNDQGIQLERRQNYGIWVACTEKQRQQAILTLLWGAAPFGKSLFSVSFQQGLIFSLDEDAHFLPPVEKINAILKLIDLKRIFNKIVFVEDFLHGRFTDDAVLFLALVLSVLMIRIKLGEHMQFPTEMVSKLKQKPVWNAAFDMIKNLESLGTINWNDDDITYVALYILSSPRVESWPSTQEQDNLIQELSSQLLQEVSESYEIDDLVNDPTLREGLVNHLIPVCNQQEFDLWAPRTQSGLPQEEKYAKEFQLANSLLEIIHRTTGIELPEEELSMIAALLRAAYIRLRPHDLHEVLVVCPSGMATAQLLNARLIKRFPRLGKLNIVSFRELDQAKVAAADLVITLMPLPDELTQGTPVIQVSPQLLPEDIEAITSFLS
ncbi:MAG: PRD domain-containing protein [Anaerolineales bacterium]|nr:PRD domain-containing protein [Anaerolineales bacterium]